MIEQSKPLILLFGDEGIGKVDLAQSASFKNTAGSSVFK